MDPFLLMFLTQSSHLVHLPLCSSFDVLSPLSPASFTCIPFLFAHYCCSCFTCTIYHNHCSPPSHLVLRLHYVSFSITTLSSACYPPFEFGIATFQNHGMIILNSFLDLIELSLFSSLSNSLSQVYPLLFSGHHLFSKF